MTYTITSRPNSQTSDYFTTMLIGQQTDDQITGRGKVDGDDIQHIISGYYAGQTGKWSLDANADVLLQKQNSDNLTFEDATQGDDRTVTTRNDVKNRLYAAKFVAAVTFTVPTCSATWKTSSMLATRRLRKTARRPSSN